MAALPEWTDFAEVQVAHVKGFVIADFGRITAGLTVAQSMALRSALKAAEKEAVEYHITAARK